MIESGLPWEFGVYGDEEEELAAKSEDPIMKRIWDDKIPVVDINIKKVFKGTHAIINWVISEKIQHSYKSNIFHPFSQFSRLVELNLLH